MIKASISTLKSKLSDYVKLVRGAFTFDLTRDHPDNRIEINGREVRFGSFERSTDGYYRFPDTRARIPLMYSLRARGQ